jgi:hypothetical protein
MELKIHQEIKTVVDNTSRTSGQQNSCGVKSEDGQTQQKHQRRTNPTKTSQHIEGKEPII